MDQPHVLVVGAGSAGKRYARNLRELGCRVSACDPRADRAAELAAEGATVATFGDLERALNGASFNGFVIASPPVYHVDQARDMLHHDHDAWVLCEKPLSTNEQRALALEPYADRILLAYTYRWWPPIQRFRLRLRDGEIGRLRHVRFVMSAHLEDWHPWEPYQQFFMARRELGGGALLDESHFVDLMLWIFGMPDEVYARVEKISALEIDSDDNVDIVAAYASGLRATLHLDLMGRPHDRAITVVGDAGTLSYSYESNAIRVGHTGAADWTAETFACERNEMFMGVSREFLDLIRGDRRSPSCGVGDGVRALSVVDACRRSSDSGAVVKLNP